MRIWIHLSFYFLTPMKKQLLAMIFPLNGQKQLSIGRTWHADVRVTPVASIAVQLVQCEVTPALAGFTSSAALKSIAAKLPSKRNFLFIGFLFLPFFRGP
jgi:hypothetical protein